MKVLAIDSSGLTASVAIVEDTHTVAEYTINWKKTHSQTLLPMIDEMVKMVDFHLVDVDAIAIAGGPGSFTGLRIGSATAKGLGLALNKPLIHVPTVDSLAYQVYGCGDIICPIMDARREQVYTGIYTFSREAGKEEGTKEVQLVFQVLEPQTVISVEELIRELNHYNRPAVLLGDAVPVYREILSAGLKVPYSFAPAYMNRQRAAVVGELGIRYYQAGKYVSAGEHRPEYLRLSQAERERKQKEKAAESVVRRMEAEDAAAVAEIEYQSFPDPWSQKSVLETVANPQTICLTVEKAGRIVGYLLAYRAGDEAEIARVAVLGEQQNQGIGRKILEILKEICREEKIQKLMLDVRKSNEGARAFYAKAGFIEDGIRREFYSKPQEDAVLMSQEIV